MGDKLTHLEETIFKKTSFIKVKDLLEGTTHFHS